MSDGQNKMRKKKGADEVIGRYPESIGWRLRSIVEDGLLCEGTPDVQVLVGKVSDMSQMSALIRYLSAEFPIPRLHHLKRIKKNEIILRLTGDGYNNIEDALSKEGFKFSDLSTVNVSSTFPRTRKQFDEINRFWPCNFHERKYLERLLACDLFTEEEIVQFDKYMRMAVEAAGRSRGEIKSGAVVVDPLNGTVMAVASDHRDEHPLKHSTMVAVDLVARSQNGGAWVKSPSDYNFSPVDNDVGGVKNHKKRGGDGQQIADVNTDSGSYLCTDYYIFITREPCTMCAMALVHSRIRRVFYGCVSKNGALGTLSKLHTVKGLNHHYEVFTGILENECTQLCR